MCFYPENGKHEGIERNQWRSDLIRLNKVGQVVSGGEHHGVRAGLKCRYVDVNQRDSFEAKANIDGEAPFHFREAGPLGHFLTADNRPASVPVYFIEPRQPNAAAGCIDFMQKPFDCETLYECLERHLKVTLERETISSELPPLTALEHVALPDSLGSRMAVAAELHSTTALKACLPELHELSPATRRLAEEIRMLMRSYEMDGIQRPLARYVSRIENTEPTLSRHATQSDS